MVSKRFATPGMPLALVPLVASRVGEQIHFSDDFEDAAESAAKWEVIAGDGQVADALYRQLSAARPRQASMVAPDRWKDEWVEYAIEFKVRSLTPGDAPVHLQRRSRGRRAGVCRRDRFRPSATGSN